MLKSTSVLLTLIFAWFLFAYCHETIETDLPFHIDQNQVKPLRQLVNPQLQRNLETVLRSNKKWDYLISRKKMAVGLVDISDPQNIKFARVNGDVMMYAASLPKLAILFAAYQAFEDSTLQEAPEILNDLHLMIARSDNAAATRMIDRIGFERIQKTLMDPKYELYDLKRGGGLWVGKRYAKTGIRIPDPLMGISHGATVTQVCRFYYLLAIGRLINRERSIQMLEMLVDPELHHKFVNTYDHLAPDAKLYRKSGTWQKWHADSVLIWGPVWRRYILTALIESEDGETICRNVIPAVESVLKNIDIKSTQ